MMLNKPKPRGKPRQMCRVFRRQLARPSKVSPIPEITSARGKMKANGATEAGSLFILATRPEVKAHHRTASGRTVTMIPKVKPASPNLPPRPASRQYHHTTPPSPSTKANQRAADQYESQASIQNRPLNTL